MHQSWIKAATCFLTLLSSWSFATCCQSFDLGTGWRRDGINWNAKEITDSSLTVASSSDLHFHDINSYIIHGNLRWVDYGYYIRASGEYGWTYKGEAKEHFKIGDDGYFSSGLWSDIFSIGVHHPVKRNSELYDFSGAVGYPLAFYNCRLSVVPVIGFSFHRQRIRVKEEHVSPSSFFSSSSTSLSSNFVTSPSDLIPSSSSSSDFNSFLNNLGGDSFSSSSVSSSDVSFDSSSRLFSSGSSSNEIAPYFGKDFGGHISNYRLTWYGFFVGLDLAYALDSSWTLFTELEYHFLDSCHRKRHSFTGIYFVDIYHKESYAYGFNGTVGTTFCMSNCWYGSLAVDFKLWTAHGHDDHVEWRSVAARAALGYQF